MTDETLLLRQIHPTFVQNGRVTSQAFKPTEKDQFLLSTYDGDLIDAEAAWEHYTQGQGCASVGALAVNLIECRELRLQARPDPEPFPEHAVIDFSAHGERKAVEKCAKKLSIKADGRGWVYTVG